MKTKANRGLVCSSFRGWFAVGVAMGFAMEVLLREGEASQVYCIPPVAVSCEDFFAQLMSFDFCAMIEGRGLTSTNTLNVVSRLQVVSVTVTEYKVDMSGFAIGLIMEVLLRWSAGLHKYNTSVPLLPLR